MRQLMTATKTVLQNRSGPGSATGRRALGRGATAVSSPTPVPRDPPPRPPGHSPGPCPSALLEAVEMVRGGTGILADARPQKDSLALADPMSPKK
jgi:hypothetical protein